jgi:hypothetical protein
MAAAGIIDPVAVGITALRNAASVAALILTTQTLIAKKPDYGDPTAGAPLNRASDLPSLQIRGSPGELPGTVSKRSHVITRL